MNQLQLCVVGHEDAAIDEHRPLVTMQHAVLPGFAQCIALF